MVLVIDRDKDYAEALADIFRFCRIPAYSLHPSEALAEQKSGYRAILLGRGEEAVEEIGFLRGFREHFDGIPTFTLCDDALSVRLYNRADGCLRGIDGSLPQRLAESVSALGCVAPDEYRLGRVEILRDGVRRIEDGAYMKISKTETMILRVIASFAPHRIRSEAVVKYAYSPMRAPGESVVRTHLCALNKRAIRMLGHALVDHSAEEGYGATQ